jgi:uncharacterized protein (DUF433 family)
MSAYEPEPVAKSVEHSLPEEGDYHRSEACRSQVASEKETSMKLPISFMAKPPPIQVDGDGVLRVGGTRVRLETIIDAFKSGSAAEEILLKYPSLSLTDIYAIITYYLWCREEVEAYLEERRRIAGEVRRQNETRFPSAGVRERLLARQAPQG